MKDCPRLGANLAGPGRCDFLLWAPKVSRVELRVLTPRERRIPLAQEEDCYWRASVDEVEPGTRYLYVLDGDRQLPDPASRFQPQGVHGPSQVVDPNFPWHDGDWCGLPLRDLIFYEIHVGTFTDEGTFDAVAARLDELEELGVNALELMPVSQFPGERNWGYDGVFPFAVQHSYGGPEGLKRLVDACHRRGFAVVLDVVYNHLGPEGNHLAHFAPYFTDRYRTPWGPAVNFDGPWSDEVRRFFIENALYWLSDFHIDALRLDAVHAIADISPRTFLEELVLHVEERFHGRRTLIPESAANDARLIRSRELGGYGLDAQWSDDFHHALRVLLTGEKRGYYVDYGGLEQMEKAYREGFVYSGEYSRYRRRRHGSPSKDIPVDRFVVFSQNHDQVGNRLRGSRLAEDVCFERLKLAAAAVLLSPYLPLVFMGEEHGEKQPFPYFVSHSDVDLIEAVRRGRREEFSAFDWQGEPPDPQSVDTFYSARLRRGLREEEPNCTLRIFYRELIRLRKGSVCFAGRSRELIDVTGYYTSRVITLHYRTRPPGRDRLMVLYHFGETPDPVTILLPPGRWQKRIDSADARWRGPGSDTPERLDSDGTVTLGLSPWSAAVYEDLAG